MKISYANDQDQEPGHGILTISQSRLAMQPLAGGRFSLRRSSDQRCLAPAGWREAEEALVPRALVQEVADIRLFVGPEVVDHFNEQEVYRLTLIAPDGERDAGTLILSDVIYSPLAGGGGLGGEREKSKTSQDGPKPPPKATPLFDVPGSGADPSGAAVGSGTEAPTGDKPEPSATTGPRPGRSRVKRFLPLLLVLVVLALSGLGAYIYFHALPDVDTETTPPPSPVPPVTQNRPDQPPIARAQAFMRDKGAPGEALTLLKDMPQTAEGRDAVFLLARYAAEAGQAEAMLMVARYYDPTDTAPTGTIIKNPAQAVDWYTKALAAGQAEARSGREALTAWLRAAADKGDASAREILARLR